MKKQKRPTDTGIPEVRTSVKRDLLYYRGQRDLLYRQKRPTIQAKETYYRGTRDLRYRQKRPTIEAKETYDTGKRDLLSLVYRRYARFRV